MKEKILAFLKTKLTGVQDAYLNGIAESYSKTITKDEDIEITLNASVLELIKLSAGHLQVEGDRRATEAQKTALKNFLEKHKLGEDGKPLQQQQQQQTHTVPSDAPEWFKTFQTKMEQDALELKNKLAAMETEKTQSELLTKAQTKLKEKGIPEWFTKPIVRNLKIESEDKIDQLVATLEGDYATSKQLMAEQGVIISVPAAGGGGTPEGEAVAKSIAEKRNTKTTDGVPGKKV